MPDNFFGQKSVGDPKDPHGWTQLQSLTNPQQFAQQAMLAKGLYGMLQPQPSFEPIKNEYMRQYREANGPGLMSNFTGNMNGGDYQRAVGMGDQDMLSRLAALHQNFNQHQYDQNREQSTQLLQQGMKPSFENMYSTIPYDDAKNALIREGNPYPSEEQIQARLPLHQPQKPLSYGDIASSAQGYARSARDQYKDLSKSYQTGGAQGLKNALKETANNAIFGGTTPQQIQEKKSSDNAKAVADATSRDERLRSATDKNLKSQNPTQKSISEEVIAMLANDNPAILRTNLSAGDYADMKNMLDNGRPEIKQVIKLLRNRKDLLKVKKYHDNGSTFRLGRFLDELTVAKGKMLRDRAKYAPKMLPRKS